MHLDRPLQIGAIGRHGPIRYEVTTYEPGRRVCFRLIAPQGFDGFHGFEVVSVADTGTMLRHVLAMEARGRAVVTWPLVFRPLHDALIEDCLDTAAHAVGDEPRLRTWSIWVRLLRGSFRLFRRWHRPWAAA